MERIFNLNVCIPICVGADDNDLLTEEENIVITAFYIHTLLVNLSKMQIDIRT